MGITNQFWDNIQISDLMYSPGEGAFYYGANLSMSSLDYDVDVTSSGVVAAKYTVEGGSTMTKHALAYGVTSDFTLGVIMGYSFKESYHLSKYSLGGVVKTPGTEFNNKDVDDKGINDPVIVSSYSVYKDDAVIWDLLASFSPSLGDNEEGSTEGASAATYKTTEGNALRGGHQVTVGTQIGSAKGAFQWVTEFELEYNLEQTKEAIHSLSANTKSTVDPHMNFKLGVGAQYALIDKLQLGLDLAVAMTGELEEIPTATPTAIDTSESHNDFHISARVQYLFAKNVLGYIKGEYAIIGDYDIKTAGTTDVSKVKDYTSKVLLAGVDFEF